MKLLLVLLLVASSTSFANENCVKIVHGFALKSMSKDEVKKFDDYVRDDLKLNKEQYLELQNAEKKIFSILKRETEMTSGPLDGAPYLLNWKVNKSGSLQASCDCEKVLNASKNLDEAKSVLKLLKATVAHVNKGLIRLDKSSTKIQNMNFCVEGKLATRGNIYPSYKKDNFNN